MKKLLLTTNIIPFPYFLIDDEFNIIQASDLVTDLFLTVNNFLDIVEPEQVNKAREFILGSSPINKMELNLLCQKNGYILYDVYIQYETANRIHLFCINKENKSEQLEDVVLELEEKLLVMNHALNDKTAKLEKSLEKMKITAIEQDNLATIGKLAASIAHEIRNPLTSVKGFVQLLKPYLRDIGKENYADIAISEIDRANDIIYEFLNASKTSEPSFDHVWLRNVLEETMLLCQSESLIKNCQFVYKKPNHDVYVYADVKQLKQVLLNIIKNAMDAIEEGDNAGRGTIKIEINDLVNVAEITISDNGTGMKKEVMDNLFTPFFTTKDRGTGIGLAVCKKIINEHKGSIIVESEIGKGTTFRIRLPKQ